MTDTLKQYYLTN